MLDQRRFVLDFPRACSCIFSGPGTEAGVALYVDVDEDGECNPSVDEVFVWAASTFPNAVNVEVSLTPESERCADVEALDQEGYVLAAARELCPRVDSCLGFCDSSGSADSGGSPLLCGGP